MLVGCLSSTSNSALSLEYSKCLSLLANLPHIYYFTELETVVN